MSAAGADDNMLGTGLPASPATPADGQPPPKRRRLSYVTISNHPTQPLLASLVPAYQKDEVNLSSRHKPNNPGQGHSDAQPDDRPCRIRPQHRQLDASRAPEALAQLDEATEKQKGVPYNHQVSSSPMFNSHAACMRDSVPSDFGPDSPVAPEIEPEGWPTAIDAADVDMGTNVFSDLWAPCSRFLELGGLPQSPGWPSAAVENLEDEAPFDVFKLDTVPDLVPDDLEDEAPFDVFNLDTFPDLIPEDLDDGSAPQSDAFANPADRIAVPEGNAAAAPSALLPPTPIKMAPGVCGNPYGAPAKLMTADGQDLAVDPEVDVWDQLMHGSLCSQANLNGGPAKLMAADGQDLAVDPDVDLWDQLMHGSPCSQQTHETLPSSSQEPPAAPTQPNVNGFGLQSAHGNGWHGSEWATQQAWRVALDPHHHDGSSGVLQVTLPEDEKARTVPKAQGRAKGGRKGKAKNRIPDPALAYIPSNQTAEIYPLQQPPGKDLRVKMYEEQFQETRQHFDELDASDAETGFAFSEAAFGIPLTSLYQVRLYATHCESVSLAVLYVLSSLWSDWHL